MSDNVEPRAGTGVVACALAGSGCRVTEIDSSPEMLVTVRIQAQADGVDSLLTLTPRSFSRMQTAEFTEISNRKILPEGLSACLRLRKWVSMESVVLVAIFLPK